MAKRAPIPRKTTASTFNRETALLACVISLLSILAFLPALGNEFVGDDLGNFLENRNFVGIGLQGIGWAFTTKTLGVYQPLSWIILEMQRSVFGLDPRGYHWSVSSCTLSIARHFVFLSSIFSNSRDRKPPKRTHTLSHLGVRGRTLRCPPPPNGMRRVGILSALSYLCFLSSSFRTCLFETWRALRGSLLFRDGATIQSGALMFPVWLVLMDIYPLKRFARAWKEKTLFFALTLLFVGVSLWARSGYGGMAGGYGLFSRIVSACYGIVFFLWKSLYPRDSRDFTRRPARRN